MHWLFSWQPDDQVFEFVALVATAVTLVSSIALAAARLLKHRPALQHCILLSALLSALAGPLIVSAFAISGRSLISFPLFDRHQKEVAADGSLSPAEPSVLNSEQRGAADSTFAAEDLFDHGLGEPIVSTPDDLRRDLSESNGFEGASHAAAPAPPTRYGFVGRIGVCLLILWVIGALAMLCGLLRSWFRLSRIRRSLIFSKNETLHVALGEATKSLGLKSPPTLAISTRVHSPFVFGLLRPVIVLPSNSLAAITGDQLRDVLLHEISHVLRGDHIVLLLQQIARALFWPIVPIHFLNKALTCARENVCDNYVLACNDAVNYCETLLRMAELSRGSASHVAAVGILRWHESLEDRVAGMINKNRDTQTRAGRLNAIAIIALFALTSLLVCGTTLFPAEARHSTFVQGHYAKDLKTDEALILLRQQCQFVSDQRFSSGQLRNLTLWKVNESAWKTIGELTTLQGLEIAVSDLSTDAFQQIGMLKNLHSLTISNSQFSPLQLAPLAKLTELEHLDVNFEVLSESDQWRAEQLGELNPSEQKQFEKLMALPHAKQKFVQTAILTDRALVSLSDMKQLKTLRLANTFISGAGLNRLAELTALEEIDVSLLGLSTEEARSLQYLPRLRSLRYFNASDDIVAELSALKSLQKLDIWSGDVTDQGAEHLAKLGILLRLEIRGNRMTDRGLELLTRLSALEYLDIQYAKSITPAGINQFRSVLPNCQVVNSELESTTVAGTNQSEVEKTLQRTETSSPPTNPSPQPQAQPSPSLQALIAGLQKTETAIKNLSVTTDYVKLQKFGLPVDKPVRMELVTQAIIDNTGRAWNDTLGQQVNIEPNGKDVRLYNGRWTGAFDGNLARSMDAYEDRGYLFGSIDKYLSWHGISPGEFTTHYQRKSISEILQRPGSRLVKQEQWDNRSVTVVDTAPQGTEQKRKYRFWIDPARKVVVRRALLIQFAPDQEYQEYTRIETWGHKEIAPEIWLPTRVKYESVEVTKEQTPEELSWSYTGTNKDWKVNQDLPDDTFVLSFPDHVRVTDRVKKEPLPQERNPLKVVVLDKQGQPIKDVIVLLYDGHNFWAGLKQRFESASQRTNQQGTVEFTSIPDVSYHIQVKTNSESFSGSYTVLHQEKLLKKDPLIQIDSTHDAPTVTFTMRKHIDLDFDVVDAQTKKKLTFALIHFKDDRVPQWTTLAILDAGGQHDNTTIIEEMSSADYLAAKQGYYPREFKLTEALAGGRKSIQPVLLKPAPSIRLTVLDAEGAAVEGAKLKYIGPAGIDRGSYTSVKKTSPRGRTTIEYPGLGNLVRYQITHDSGQAEFAIKDLPEPVVVEQDGISHPLILHQVRLKR